LFHSPKHGKFKIIKVLVKVQLVKFGRLINFENAKK
jgi:hypothetical protein